MNSHRNKNLVKNPPELHMKVLDNKIAYSNINRDLNDIDQSSNTHTLSDVKYQTKNRFHPVNRL